MDTPGSTKRGEKDVVGVKIVPGDSVILCWGYACKQSMYVSTARVPAKVVTDRKHVETVTVCVYNKRTRKMETKQRGITRKYGVKSVMLRVGKFGIVFCRNKHLQSNWDVLVDGLVYVISAKYMRVLRTQEDIDDVNDHLPQRMGDA